MNESSSDTGVSKSGGRVDRMISLSLPKRCAALGACANNSAGDSRVATPAIAKYESTSLREIIPLIMPGTEASREAKLVGEATVVGLGLQLVEQQSPPAARHRHRLAIREQDFSGAVAERLRFLDRVEANDRGARDLE